LHTKKNKKQTHTIMKKAFITVRYDRMKNIEFKVLCQDIMSLTDLYDGEEMHLTRTFQRFGEQKQLLANLSSKQRKMSQSKEISILRKRLDDMVSGLLLNIKSLKRAQFEFQKEELKLVYDTTRKQFENYIHEGVFSKDGSMNAIFRELKINQEFYNAYQHLGLLKFTDAFTSLLQQIKDLSESRKADKRKLPPVGITIPSKETITDELRFFLTSIEMTARTYPETDYDGLIHRINMYLTDARGYLRNLASRRITAKAKEEKKKGSDETDVADAKIL